MSLTTSLFLIAYVILFFSAVAGMRWWDRRGRRTRKPFREDVKLLRMPGESLWRRVIDNDESDSERGMLVLGGSFLVSSGLLWAIAKLSQPSLAVFLVIVVVIGAISVLLCAQWYHNRLGRRADDYLGLFGERYVSECLEPLKAQGWFIFHDVPALGATGKFNLDHVAVGPDGIWVIETKARRKGRALPERKEHEILFDGDKLIYPWGEDREALQQAENNARWLQDCLKKLTGKQYPVSAALTFPAYYVTESKLGPVRVLNPNGLVSALTGYHRQPLDPESLDLIRRQLDSLCRNVEY